jgi:hypothetical protein
MTAQKPTFKAYYQEQMEPSLKPVEEQKLCINIC